MRHPGVDVGSTLAGRFEITGLLGGGGMAFVYRAVDLKHDRPAAVKVLQVKQTRSDEFRRRFEREAQLADYAFHPHILPIWASGEDSGVFYIATPLADFDLAALIEENPQGIDPRRVTRIINQIAHALDFAHRRNIVHRDVKPENILILENQAAGDHAYLADFGIAKDVASDDQLTATKFVPLSPPTAAPEQITGDSVLSGRADQYALACTMYEALCGQSAYIADNTRDMLNAHLYSDPPPISTVNRNLPVAINNVLAKGMAKDPQQRYGSCQEFVAAARSALGIVDETTIERLDLRDTEAEVDTGQTILDPGRSSGSEGRTELEDQPPSALPRAPRPAPPPRKPDPPRPAPPLTPGSSGDGPGPPSQPPQLPPFDPGHHRRGEPASTPWFKRTPVIAGALVLVAVAGVAAAFAAGGGGGDKKSSTSTQASASTGTTTAQTETQTTTTDTTTTDQTTTTTPDAPDAKDPAGAPQSARYRQSDMRTLYGLIPAGYHNCAAIRWSGSQDRLDVGKEPPGANAAIKCRVDAGRNMKAYYIMFTTDARMNSAFRDYIDNAAFGFKYKATERSCGGRPPEPIRWTADDEDAGRLDCLSVPYIGDDTQYTVVWSANEPNVLSVLQDTSSMRTVYLEWRDAGPLF